MKALRTPDERFADLPGWSYEPRYAELIEGMRLHYVDEGPRSGPVFLCLHGEPTWAYLYRKMIPVLVEAGARVVAPDWYGFGRSDKPVDDASYTFGFHRDTLVRLVEHLGLARDVTLVCQDWGGLLGLTLPVTHPELLSRLLIMNTAIATGMSPGRGFLEWRDFVANNPDFDVVGLMRRAVPGIADAEAAAYGAPFPTPEHKAGVRRFPAIVPIRDDMDGADFGKQAAMWWSTAWKGDTFMAVGAQDPVLGPKVMELMRGIIRGCPEPVVLEDAGHFVQERGDVVARAALEAFGGA
jgi:pimeloyl-ACP methyl ester carboxylesterase